MASGAAVGAITGAARLMRKSVIFPVVLHTLPGVVTLLWLLWLFMPGGNVMKGLGTLLLAGLACWYVLKNCRDGDSESAISAATVDLPLLDIRQPSRPVGAMPHRSVCWGWLGLAYRERPIGWLHQFPVSWPCSVRCAYPPAMRKVFVLW